jgi:uncharacterized protein (DUF1330 family)
MFPHDLEALAHARGLSFSLIRFAGPQRVGHDFTPERWCSADEWSALIMKTRYTVILSMIAGAALGGAAIQGLHAQAKPPVYLVTEIDVTNPDAYAKEFAPKAQAIIKAAGGRFIAIGGLAGVGAKPVTALQGTPPKRVTIQVWDSHEALKAWFNGADYQAALKIGEKYATFRRFAVEGVSQ